ncbi:MAG: cysteine--tRNA ligase, partial [Candidatus Omnitrophota bacterium]
MPIKIFNSLTKQKEVFEPINPGIIKMYVCGPTVYDEPHIGHLRSAYVFDMIRRYLSSSYCGYKVTFVRNVTDVDDKIIERAKRLYPDSTDPKESAERVSTLYLNRYHEDLAELGIPPPDLEPKATQTIGAMIELIRQLIQSEFAYAADGDVYFSVNKFSDYGKLSKQNKHSMLENVRLDKNDKKRDVLDFALWKKSKTDEPSWDSPWGAGRPGWHIECSAMNRQCLGK